MEYSSDFAGRLMDFCRQIVLEDDRFEFGKEKMYK